MFVWMKSISTRGALLNTYAVSQAPKKLKKKQVKKLFFMILLKTN